MVGGGCWRLKERWRIKEVESSGWRMVEDEGVGEWWVEDARG